MTYTETIDRLSRKLRVDASFDLMSRPVMIGGRLSTLFFVDGFTKDEAANFKTERQSFARIISASAPTERIKSP